MGSFLDIVYLVIAFLVVLSVHEAAHALVAYYLGDSTAKLEGRITLNPKAHLDPMGTLILLVTGLIGWGKPVPVNPRNFNHPVRDSAIVALAGPMSNFVLAFVLAIPLVYAGNVLPEIVTDGMWQVLNLSIYLGVFNFLPLPPLDGSKILGLIVPKRWHPQYEEFLDNGIRYFVIFLLVDWFLLRRMLGVSLLGWILNKMYLAVLTFLGIIKTPLCRRPLLHQVLLVTGGGSHTQTEACVNFEQPRKVIVELV